MSRVDDNGNPLPQQVNARCSSLDHHGCHLLSSPLYSPDSILSQYSAGVVSNNNNNNNNNNVNTRGPQEQWADMHKLKLLSNDLLQHSPWYAFPNRDPNVEMNAMKFPDLWTHVANEEETFSIRPRPKSIRQPYQSDNVLSSLKKKRPKTWTEGSDNNNNNNNNNNNKNNNPFSFFYTPPDNQLHNDKQVPIDPLQKLLSGDTSTTTSDLLNTGHNDGASNTREHDRHHDPIDDTAHASTLKISDMDLEYILDRVASDIFEQTENIRQSIEDILELEDKTELKLEGNDDSNTVEATFELNIDNILQDVQNALDQALDQKIKKQLHKKKTPKDNPKEKEKL
ncbi:hypothetical protein RFI_21251 [Reticulomyxa filosa]|uniref:Uncharacterized protein n=1 Tax=Reticulomyxa filosa TaxID=46433 RepID=X6MSM0_RETFI|nr:hypothetical protein RFI_21251 [Reticulomyxa filosa]|eukprot:ETO16105.1 hypothetical protein RFI_21251 [Reticulomyxa filosa]